MWAPKNAPLKYFCFTSIDIFYIERGFYYCFQKNDMFFIMNGIRINRASLAKSWTREEDFCFCSLLWDFRENSKWKGFCAWLLKKKNLNLLLHSIEMFLNTHKMSLHKEARFRTEISADDIIFCVISSHIRAVELLVSRTWCKKISAAARVILSLYGFMWLKGDFFVCLVSSILQPSHLRLRFVPFLQFYYVAHVVVCFLIT